MEIDSEFVLADLDTGQLKLGLFGDSLRGELDSGADVPRLPPMRIGGRFSWTGPVWTIWALVVDADEQDKPGDNEESTRGYTRWDLGAEYRRAFGEPEMTLSLELKNIGDEEIRLSTSFLRDIAPEAGRSVVAALRYTF